MSWEREEWKDAEAARMSHDYSPVRRFAGGIEIVGDPEDALDDRVAERNTDDEKGGR